MSDDLDIREWAKREGLEVNGRGPVRKSVREQFEQANGVADAPAGELETASTPAETAPQERAPIRPGSGGWLAKTTTPKPPKPKKVHKRVSIESVVSTAWGAIAMGLGRFEQATPVARVLAIQAPVAGVIVEDIAKDTIVDKLLQPIARMGEGAEKVAALVGPPLLVGALSARPEMYPLLAPMLRYALISWMELAGPAMKKAKERAEKLAQEFDVAEVDEMIAMIFAPTAPATPDVAGGQT